MLQLIEASSKQADDDPVITLIHAEGASKHIMLVHSMLKFLHQNANMLSEGRVSQGSMM